MIRVSRIISYLLLGTLDWFSISCFEFLIIVLLMDLVLINIL